MRTINYHVDPTRLAFSLNAAGASALNSLWKLFHGQRIDSKELIQVAYAYLYSVSGLAALLFLSRTSSRSSEDRARPPRVLDSIYSGSRTGARHPARASSIWTE